MIIAIGIVPAKQKLSTMPDSVRSNTSARSEPAALTTGICAQLVPEHFPTTEKGKWQYLSAAVAEPSQCVPGCASVSLREDRQTFCKLRERQYLNLTLKVLEKNSGRRWLVATIRLGSMPKVEGKTCKKDFSQPSATSKQSSLQAMSWHCKTR